jgi:hypothetical protein
MNQRIIYPNDQGGIVIIIPAPEYMQTHTIEELAAKDVPAGKPYKIIDVSEIPSNRLFRKSWKFGDTIIIDLDDAKQIAHENRRKARAEEFAPFDDIIMKQIPGNDMASLEASRQAIRDKYSQIQVNIDQAQTVEELTNIVESL